jgi:hypothetical protein
MNEPAVIAWGLKTVNKAVKMAPAMAAGVSQRLWEMSDIVALIDAAAGAPKKRGPYRKAA